MVCHRAAFWEKAKNYFDTTKARKFKLHNFRGMAMSKARVAGISTDDAAIAFDCTVATMQQHYLAFDKARVADELFSRIQNGDVGRAQQNGANGENVGRAPQNGGDREPGPGPPGKNGCAQQNGNGAARAQQDDEGARRAQL
jgi:hypothetical protein